MKRTIIEYQTSGGKPTVLRFLDAATIPPQPCAGGCAHLELDHADREQAELAEEIKRRPKDFIIEHNAQKPAKDRVREKTKGQAR